jgi:hypothetical protein
MDVGRECPGNLPNDLASKKGLDRSRGTWVGTTPLNTRRVPCKHVSTFIIGGKKQRN